MRRSEGTFPYGAATSLLPDSAQEERTMRYGYGYGAGTILLVILLVILILLLV